MAASKVALIVGYGRAYGVRQPVLLLPYGGVTVEHLEALGNNLHCLMLPAGTTLSSAPR